MVKDRSDRKINGVEGLLIDLRSDELKFVVNGEVLGAVRPGSYDSWNEWFDYCEKTLEIDERINELSDDIVASGGILEPVNVETDEDDGSLYIANGFHRMAAARRLELDSVPAVLDAPDPEAPLHSVKVVVELDEPWERSSEILFERLSFRSSSHERRPWIHCDFTTIERRAKVFLDCYDVDCKELDLVVLGRELKERTPGEVLSLTLEDEGAGEPLF